MPKQTPGQYFLSRGVSPGELADRLERLLPTERDVVLARSSGATLREIAARLDLTAEGVRYLEGRALGKLRGGPSSEEIQRFRQAVEQRLGVPLERAAKGLTRLERQVVLAYAEGRHLAELAPELGLSINEVTALRDRAVSQLMGETRGSRAGNWAGLKAAVVAALAERPRTYEELEALFPMSRRRTMKLLGELVLEGRADVGDEYPMLFSSLERPEEGPAALEAKPPKPKATGDKPKKTGSRKRG